MRPLAGIKADIIKLETNIRVWSGSLTLRKQNETNGGGSLNNRTEIRNAERDIEAAEAALKLLEVQVFDIEQATEVGAAAAQFGSTPD